MMRRLTIACGLLTVAVVLALAVLPNQKLFGARSPHPAATGVTAIPDKPVPSFWPPVEPVPPSPPPLKGLPPAPRPTPLHHAPQAAQPAPRAAAPGRHVTIDRAFGIFRTLLNLPKVLDQVQIKPGN